MRGGQIGTALQARPDGGFSFAGEDAPDRAKGYTVVVLSNYDRPNGGRVDRKLRTLITRGAQTVA